MTTLHVQSYREQATLWPASGRHVLAQYDDESVVVYQAYRPSIGHFAVKNGAFGGEFSLGRMSWIGVDALITPRERVYPCKPSSMVGTDPHAAD